MSTGLLDVGFERRGDGRTVLTQRRQRFPLRMTVPLYLDEGDPSMAFVYVQNPTGAVFAADELDMRLRAGAGARVHLTSQSATKLMPAGDGEAAHQELRVEVGPGAVVEVVPDVLIPHRGARYRQVTRVALDEDASFIGIETLAPGRLPLGERFAYDHVSLHSTVSRGGRTVCADTLDLTPARHSPGEPGILGGFDWIGSMLVVAPHVERASLVAEVNATGATAESGAVLAAGLLPDQAAGIVVRTMAGDALTLKRMLRGAWDVARRAVIGVPAPRERK